MTVLDWRDRSNWSWRRAMCRYCGLMTHLRDDEGMPAHKVCTELWIDRPSDQ